MSEQYRFMRYFLPGSLFLLYLMILILPNLTRFPSQQDIIEIFVGAFVASPIIGYLIYAFFNEYWYEPKAKQRTIRGGLRFIEDLKFVNENTRPRYKTMLKCFTQKKELLDLIYHSTLHLTSTERGIEISPQILSTLKNHLSAYSARIVCGVFVPVFCMVLFLVLVICDVATELFGFTWNPIFLLLSGGTIGILSLILYRNAERVLKEAYQLEEYLIKAKRRVIEQLLQELFP